LLADAAMIGRIGMGEQVIAHAQVLLRLQEPAVEILEHFTRGLALFVGAHHDGRAM